MGQVFRRILLYSQVITRVVLDLVFPRSAVLERLEEMTPAEFAAAVPPAPEEEEGWRYALFAYEDPLVAAAIRELKYRGNRRVARLFGEVLSSFLLEELAEEMLFAGGSRPIIAPMPLSRARRRERGWNQSELVAEHLLPEVCAAADVRTDILAKIRDTESQTHLNRRERLTNLAGSFAVLKPDLVRGRTIFLVDDVTTTGATFTEARKTLLAAGVKEVRCIALAH